MPLAGRDKLFVLSRTRDTEIHRESGTMSRRPLANLYPAASFGVSVPLSFYFQPKINELDAFRRASVFRKKTMREKRRRRFEIFRCVHRRVSNEEEKWKGIRRLYRSEKFPTIPV